MGYMTIRQTAATGLISEHHIRRLVAAGACPGIRSGSRFLVNFEQLTAQLEQESRDSVQRKGDA